MWSRSSSRGIRRRAGSLEPLYSLDTAGRVLYVGTFSKTMLPSVRTGFVLAPPGLRDAIVAARQLGDGYGQMATQAALARFIDEGQLARHVRKAGKAYAARHAQIVAALSDIRRLEVVPSAAGLHVTALLRAGDSGPVVAAAAAKRGLVMDDLRTYSTRQAGFVLGFGAVDPALIGEGMAILAGLVDT